MTQSELELLLEAVGDADPILPGRRHHAGRDHFLREFRLQRADPFLDDVDVMVGDEIDVAQAEHPLALVVQSDDHGIDQIHGEIL